MRLIDADKLKELLHEYCIDNDPYCQQIYDFLGIDDVIDDAFIRPYEKGYNKAKQKYERQSGHWENPFEYHKETYHKCSLCHCSINVPMAMGILTYTYCPNCGARMMEEVEE